MLATRIVFFLIAAQLLQILSSERTTDGIGWYGWLIDYSLEGRILQDYFDHKLTTAEHWAKLREPETFTYGEFQWDVSICKTVSRSRAFSGLCVP